MPLEHTLTEFRSHRFDCDLSGARYYLDDELVHQDNRGPPSAGGTIQLKLWADGNRWWSGKPSTSDTYLHVRRIEAYFNTTSKSDIRASRGSAKCGKKCP